jgi:hypothetical protein
VAKYRELILSSSLAYHFSFSHECLSEQTGILNLKSGFYTEFFFTLFKIIKIIERD